MITLPPKDHPVWRIIQISLSYAGILLLIWHQHYGLHLDGADAAVGALVVKELVHLIHGGLAWDSTSGSSSK